jgi:hypothetical protein
MFGNFIKHIPGVYICPGNPIVRKIREIVVVSRLN